MITIKPPSKIGIFPSKQKNMEDPKTRVEMMKPILLKAGIPLAISVAGFIFSRLVKKRSSIPKTSESDNQKSVGHEESFLSFDSSSLPCLEDEDYGSRITHFTNPLAMFPSFNMKDMEEEVLRLRQQIEELQDREWKVETRFIEYCNMKDQETVLRELESTLLLDMAHLEFLEKEVSSLESETRSFEELVVGFSEILKQNSLLQRKVKKLCRKTSRLSRVISEKNMLIEDKEQEISMNRLELKGKSSVVNSLENQISELQTAMEKFQAEKSELSSQLDLSEKATSQKVELHERREKEYNQLVDELKKLQKDQTDEFNQLIYLRWSNACLRHQLLMSKNLEQQTKIEENFEGGEDSVNRDQLAIQVKGNVDIEGLRIGNELNNVVGGGQSHSRRQKLIKKLKKWVDGSEKPKHEAKCFRRSLASVGTEQDYLPPRKSYSSV